MKMAEQKLTRREKPRKGADPPRQGKVKIAEQSSSRRAEKQVCSSVRHWRGRKMGELSITDRSHPTAASFAGMPRAGAVAVAQAARTLMRRWALQPPSIAQCKCN